MLTLYKSKTLAPNPPKFSRSFYSRDFLLFSSGSLGVFCLQAFTTEGVPGVFCHTPNSEKFPAISSAVFGPKVKCETFRKSPQHPCDLFCFIEVNGYESFYLRMFKDPRKKWGGSQVPDLPCPYASLEVSTSPQVSCTKSEACESF